MIRSTFLSGVCLLVVLSVAFGYRKDVAYDPVKIYQSSIEIMSSEVKPGNLLPNFMFQQGSIEGGSVGVNIGGGRGTAKPFVPDDGCGDDIFDGAMEDERSPQLPYLTQDQWTCDRNPTMMPVWIMESNELKVTITPQYDGKVWAIYDKVRERDILYNNKAHQPANIAALKAWVAGGAEWNWSPGIIGHSVFSETQVHMSQVETDRGTILRVYEYDRYNSTTWQVDMMIYNGTFFAHPKITNPTDYDLRGYWWTCVAVDAYPSTRIFAPATHVAETSRSPVRNAPWPYFADAIENSTFQGYQGAWPTDNSYLGNHQIGDMFLRIPDTVYTPYIGHTNLDGYVLIHGHPLNGTKFYTWGQSGPGRFMQDFLAGGVRRGGDYTELQVGPAPTQMQTFALGNHSSKQWTEWFRGFDGDIDTLVDKDYSVPLAYIESWMKSSDGMATDVYDDWDEFFNEHATKTPVKILVKGQPWGALEERKRGGKLADGLIFQLADDADSDQLQEEQEPWLELLQDGTFSEETLKRIPLSYQTTDIWFEALKKSALTNGMSWLHALHIGIGSAERGNIEEPKILFQESLKLYPNPIAARNLAVLQTNPELAWTHFTIAWEILLSPDYPFVNGDATVFERLAINLVQEMSWFLQQYEWYDKMSDYINTVPTCAQNVDAFITLVVKYSTYIQNYSDAKTLLASNCFPTYAKARGDLMSMWNTVVEGLAEQAKGSPLTYVEKHQARRSTPIPDNIGCEYASDYCDNYW